MNYKQIENLYKVNGLSNFKVNNLDDILKVHKVDALKVKGYEDLTEENKKLYQIFIINYFNGYGLETRTTLIPLTINYVEEVEFLGQEKPTDDYYIPLGKDIHVLKADGTKELLREWKDETYANLKCVLTEKINYLRFEYEIDGHMEWQHVIDETTWY